MVHEGVTLVDKRVLRMCTRPHKRLGRAESQKLQAFTQWVSRSYFRQGLLTFRL